MRVALGVLCGVTGGPATYAVRLAGALARRPDIALTVLTDRPDRLEVPGADVLRVPCAGGLDRLVWQHVRLPAALARLRPALYHDTKNALPGSCPWPAVVTVHDLAHLRCPETFGAASRLFLGLSTRDAVRRARRVLVPSEWTARDAAAEWPEAAGKIRVALHGVAPARPPGPEALARVRARLGDRPFVLHVGTIQARKNVDLLVRAVRILRREGFPHRLVLAGRRGWRSEASFREIARDDTALWLGEVDDADLPALHALADAFCSPSSYEGFGFTVAEAMAAGVPVVASGVSSLPEVVGDAGVLVDALTPESFAAALARLLRDPAERAVLADRGRARMAGFTWERCAAETERVYREAAE